MHDMTGFSAHYGHWGLVIIIIIIVVVVAWLLPDSTADASNAHGP